MNEMSSSDADASIQLNEFYFSFPGLVKDTYSRLSTYNFIDTFQELRQDNAQKIKC